MTNGTALDPTDSAVTVVELLKMSFFVSPNPTYYFCVPQETRNRILKARSISDGFGIEWAVKAMIECRDNVEDAAKWLNDFAPRSR